MIDRSLSVFFLCFRLTILFLFRPSNPPLSPSSISKQLEAVEARLQAQVAPSSTEAEIMSKRSCSPKSVEDHAKAIPSSPVRLIKSKLLHLFIVMTHECQHL